MVIVALLLIRYVIFEDSATALEKDRLMRLKISERRSKRHAKALLQGARRANGGATTASSSAAANPMRRSNRISSDSKASMFANILDKTAYDLSSHLPETTDWLNVMFAQAIAGYREDVLAGGVSSHPPSRSHNHHTASRHAFGSDADHNPHHLEPEKERTARDLMEEILNRASSSFLDPIRVTEADFGDAYPIFTNARVRPADDTGRTRIEIDVDYSDQITLAIDTKLLINFPKPRFAVLPVSLSLTISRFSGTLAVELFSSDPNATVLPTAAPNLASNPSSAKPAQLPTPPRSRHQLHFSLHPDFALEASASSLLGSRAKLQDIPKIEQLLISRLRGWIMDRFVWPRYWSLTLPNLVPSPSAARNADPTHGTTDAAVPASVDSAGGGGPGQMNVGTGIERTDDSIIQPGHHESARQEMLHASSDRASHVPPRPPHSRSSSSALGNAMRTGSGMGSVEAWRAHTAGVYGHAPQQHATSLTQAALLRANSGSGGGATDSATGSDIHIEVPGSFRGSVAGAGIGLASSSAAASSLPNGAHHSSSGIRNRPGFVQ